MTGESKHTRLTVKWRLTISELAFKNSKPQEEYVNESDQGDCFEVIHKVNLRAVLRRKSDGKAWTCHMILLLALLKAEGFHSQNASLKKQKRNPWSSLFSEKAA